MTIWIIAGAAAFGAFVGLVFGVSIGAGAKADQDFQDYLRDKNSEI